MPEFGQELPPAFSNQAIREALWLRRSSPVELIGSPGPDPEQLRAILTIAARVPDHRRLFPFRFLIFQDEARAKAGDILGNAFLSDNPEADEKLVAIERQRFLRVPLVIAIVSKVDRAHRTPEWEQILCTGAVCQNLLLAAGAYGFASQWLTEWYSYNQTVLSAFGLAENERIAGFIYLGSASEWPRERQRPDLDTLITYFHDNQ